jgi:hypothetical protein
MTLKSALFGAAGAVRTAAVSVQRQLGPRRRRDVERR